MENNTALLNAMQRRVVIGDDVCPNLEDREKMMELLEPKRAGIVLSEEYQLHPSSLQTLSSSTILRRSTLTPNARHQPE